MIHQGLLIQGTRHHNPEANGILHIRQLGRDAWALKFCDDRAQLLIA
jgi:hypothetical protein